LTFNDAGLIVAGAMALHRLSYQCAWHHRSTAKPLFGYLATGHRSPHRAEGVAQNAGNAQIPR
jgi:hypothetical protein